LFGLCPMLLTIPKLKFWIPGSWSLTNQPAKVSNYHKHSAQDIDNYQQGLGYESNIYLRISEWAEWSGLGQSFYKPLYRISLRKISWENETTSQIPSFLRHLIIDSPPYPTQLFCSVRFSTRRVGRREQITINEELNLNYHSLKKGSILRRPLGRRDFRIFLAIK